MTSLQDLLNFSNVPKNEIEQRFEYIAKELMLHSVIKRGEERYAIVELEFYLYSNDHKDFITYPREMEAGRWFFHSSGVDLTFQSQDIKRHKDISNKESFDLNNNPFFGGILIRGLYDIYRNEYIFGPQKCVNELWNNFYAFENSYSEYPIIIHPAIEEINNLIENGKIVSCKRHIKIDENKRMQKIKEWVERLNLSLDPEHIKAYKDDLFDTESKYLYRFFNIIEGEKTWNAIKHLKVSEKNNLKPKFKT